MNHVIKFIARLDRKTRDRILKTIEALKHDKEKRQKMRCEKYTYKKRIGKIRIVYKKRGSSFTIVNVDFRNKVYAKKS